MLYVYCCEWPETGECLATVWDSLFRLPNLERLHIDWHMNSLALPSPSGSPLHALHNLTHLSIFPYVHSIPLVFLQNFEALIYLVIFNPSLGYTRETVASFEVGLPRLHILLLVFKEVAYDKNIWSFNESNKIVTIVHENRPPNEDEHEKELNGENSVWKEGNDALAEKLGI
ncbi:hypothetical protein DL96DRAFT_1626181 [Flagelloscypha sp. PMI_526]|nr:hypothetical protein DL96DRAFT_1626181 [Flagelloscypha sp. PMI_526]